MSKYYSDKTLAPKKYTSDLMDKEDPNDELRIPDLNKEYGILLSYSNYNCRIEMANLFSLMSTSLESGQWVFLDLDHIQKSIKNHFEYLELKKRFTALRVSSRNELTYDNDGFHIGDSSFETLNEVEKALTLKSFL